jgi:hypothetical protein
MNGFQLPLIAMRGTVVQINRRELIRRPKYRLIIRIRRRRSTSTQENRQTETEKQLRAAIAKGCRWQGFGVAFDARENTNRGDACWVVCWNILTGI